MLLLLNVVVGVRVCSSEQFLVGLLDQRLLAGQRRLGVGLLGQSDRLRSLVDSILSDLQLLVARTADDLLQMRLIGRELLASRVQLRLG